MRFRAEHRFGAAPAAVAEALGDAEFYRHLALPDVGTPEVLPADDAAPAALRLRYEFTGSLDPLARRLLGGRRLRWIQLVRVDPASGRGRLEFFAEAAPRRLHGAADFELRAEGAGTIRHLEGSLTVSVPGLGRAAEARIVPGLLRRLDLEAAALADRLSSP